MCDHILSVLIKVGTAHHLSQSLLDGHILCAEPWLHFLQVDLPGPSIRDLLSKVKVMLVELPPDLIHSAIVLDIHHLTDVSASDSRQIDCSVCCLAILNVGAYVSGDVTHHTHYLVVCVRIATQTLCQNLVKLISVMEDQVAIRVDHGDSHSCVDRRNCCKEACQDVSHL